MKIIGNPNQIVQHRVRRNGKWRIEVLFQFDDNGEKVVDVDRIPSGLLERIKKNFVVEMDNDTKDAEKSVKTEQEAEKAYVDAMTYAELKTYAKSLGINTYGMKKEDIIQTIEGK